MHAFTCSLLRITLWDSYLPYLHLTDEETESWRDSQLTEGHTAHEGQRWTWNWGRTAHCARHLAAWGQPLRWRRYCFGMPALTPHSCSAPFALLRYPHCWEYIISLYFFIRLCLPLDYEFLENRNHILCFELLVLGMMPKIRNGGITQNWGCIPGF